MSARLRSKIWIQAYLRRCSLAGAAAYVLRRGDADAGGALIKIVAADGVRLLFPSRDETGGPAWRGAPFAGLRAEQEADARIAREVDIDPDLWVIEVEDRSGAHHLTEPVL